MLGFVVIGVEGDIGFPIELCIACSQVHFVYLGRIGVIGEREIGVSFLFFGVEASCCTYAGEFHIAY